MRTRVAFIAPLAVATSFVAAAGNPYLLPLDASKASSLRGLDHQRSKLYCISCASENLIPAEDGDPATIDACKCGDTPPPLPDGALCTKCEVSTTSVQLRQGNVPGYSGWTEDPENPLISCQGKRYKGECVNGACGKTQLYGVCKSDTQLYVKVPQ